MRKLRKGQSILEYIIVLTAIVAAVVTAMTTLFSQSESSGLGKLMYQLKNRITNESARIPAAIP